MQDSQHRFPTEYQLNDGIWFPQNGDANFSYSDGDDAENYLLEVVRQASDRSSLSSELASAIRDWGSAYHLSPNRANLLRPFSDFLKGKRVLELGAGCGALTRYLGELGCKVVAVEGSQRRAEIARARTEDLTNVSVICDRIERFVSADQYDVVLVVGVLEYSRIFIDHECPEQWLLQQIVRMLDRSGTLFLAIENQLGLKYLAGAREDHLGVPFAGLNAQYSSKSAVTFGLKELQDLLLSVGLRRQSVFFPLPDYKLPTTILSSVAFSNKSFDVTALLQQSVSADLQLIDPTTFSLETAWGLAVRNDLAVPLANSFLIAASLNTLDIGQKELAWHYSVSRDPAFGKGATFRADGEKISVSRYRLRKAPAPDLPVVNALPEEPYIVGSNYWSELVRVLNKAGWSISDVADWMSPWTASLLKLVGLEKLDGASYRQLISGRFFDAAPFNFSVSENGELELFDTEWEVKPDIDLGLVLHRGFMHALVKISSVARPADGVPTIINRLYMAVMAHLGVMLSAEDISRHLSTELRIQRWVQGFTDEQISDEALAHLSNLSLKIRSPALEHEVRALNHRLADAQGELAQRDQQIAALGAELASATAVSSELSEELAIVQARLNESKAALDAIFVSRSWRLSAPLRWATQRLRGLRKV